MIPMRYLVIIILVLSFYSCNDDPSECDCYENYYDIERGKYDNTLNHRFTIEGGPYHDERKNKRGSKGFDKLSEKVVYKYLDEEDQKIRDKCLELYEEDEVEHSNCN